MDPNRETLVRHRGVKMRGGKRAGSGRKSGATDGRRQITVRIRADLLQRLKPKPALRIREIIEASLL